MRRALRVVLFGGAHAPAPGPPAESSVLVSGAGDNHVNGLYTPRGTVFGKPYYNLEGQPDDFQFSSIYWDGSGWNVILSDAATGYGNGAEDVPHPWDSAEWSAVDGAEPVPFVTEA